MAKNPPPLKVKFVEVIRLGRPKCLPHKSAIYTVLLEDERKVEVITSVDTSIHDIKRIAEMKYWVAAVDVIEETVI